MSAKSLRQEIEELGDSVLSDNIDNSHQVDNVWLVVAMNNEGGEGLPAVFQDGVALPLLTTDIDNVPKLKQLAKKLLTDQPGIKRVVLRHFSNPVDEEL